MNNLFNNVSKLFKYNWGEVFKNFVPTGAKKKIQEESYKDVNIGAIVSIVAVIVYQIIVYAVASYIVIKAYNSVFGDSTGVLAGAFKAIPFGKMIVSIITSSIIPIAVLVYNNVMKDKEQPAWFYFILFIISMLSVLYTFYTLFALFLSIVAAPILALLGIVFVVLRFLGNVSMAVGSLDFCLSFPHTQTNVQPAQNMNQPVQNQNGVVCQKCGTNNLPGSAFCQNCGNKLM